MQRAIGAEMFEAALIDTKGRGTEHQQCSSIRVRTICTYMILLGEEQTLAEGA